MVKIWLCRIAVTLAGVMVQAGDLSDWMKLQKFPVIDTSVPAPAVNQKPALERWRNILQRSEVFGDRRSFELGESASPANTALAAWLEIYDSYVPAPIPYRSITGTPVRMIADIRVPVDATEVETLAGNLEFYREQGYNAGLVVSYGDESPAALLQLCMQVKSTLGSAWITYGGAESLNVPVFQAPEKLAGLLACARVCDGALLGWRRTALHLFEPDPPFVAWIVAQVRRGNPDIAVVGEYYYGMNHRTPHSDSVIELAPTGVSGVVLSNFGFAGINIKAAVARVKLPCLGLVVGERSYYLTTHANNLGFERNFAIKRRLEERFLDAGCVGTITLHGDGSDGVYNAKINDNVSNMPTIGRKDK